MTKQKQKTLVREIFNDILLVSNLKIKNERNKKG